jgi:hypothetical protein
MFDPTMMFYDIGSVIICILSVVAAYLHFRLFFECDLDMGRWVFLFTAVVSSSMLAVFIASMLRLYPDGFRISPEIGRPAYAFLLLSLALGAIFQHRIGGKCK